MLRITILITFTIVTIFTIGFSVARTVSLDEVDVYVTDKERVCSNSGSNQECMFMIFTDKETFKNVDSLLFFKWNSADYHGEIERSKHYRLTVHGFRVPFLSWYRNIIKIEEIYGEEHE